MDVKVDVKDTKEFGMKLLGQLMKRKTDFRDESGKFDRNLFFKTLMEQAVVMLWGEDASECAADKENIHNASGMELHFDNENEVKLKFNEDSNHLILSLPEELRKNIQFSVTYILSEFDKIHNEIADISSNFTIDRISHVKNAVTTLKSAKDAWSKNSYNLPDENRKRLHGCLPLLGSAIEALEMGVNENINKICAIPQDRIRRLLNIDVKTALGYEKEAHRSLYWYIRAICVHAEIDMKLGGQKSALWYIQKGLDYLESITDSQRKRMEGWNENKDGFWIDGLNDYINFLKCKLEEIKKDPINLIIMEEQNGVRI